MAFLTERVSDTLFSTSGEPAPTYDIDDKVFGSSSAGNFTGSNYIYKPNFAPGTLSGLYYFTIQIRIKPTTLNNCAIMSYDTYNAGDNWDIGIFSSGSSLQWRKAGGASLTYKSSPAINLNQWNHLAFVKSGSTYRMFINGVLVHSRVDSFTFPSDVRNFNIGAVPSVGSNFRLNGKVDELVVTNEAEWSTDFTVPTSPVTEILPKHLIVMNFDEPQYRIIGDIAENSRMFVFNETTWALENSEDVTAGSYELSVSDGTKIVIAVPESSDKNGEIYRGVTPVEI